MDNLKKMFTGLNVEIPQNAPNLEQLMTPIQGRTLLAAGLRDYAAAILSPEKEKEFCTLYDLYGNSGQEEVREQYVEAAFARYQDTPLSKAAAEALYQNSLTVSVSRLETFASCAFCHYLQYGLHLREREEFGFESVDLGNVYHHVLEGFASRLKEKGETWRSFDEAFAAKAIGELMEQEAAQYGESVLYSSQRNLYQIKRMTRIMLRTVTSLQKQLLRGDFEPKYSEWTFLQKVSFEEENDEDRKVKIETQDRVDGETAAESNTPSRNLRIVGKVDRIDLAKNDGQVYVKILDFKSSDHKIDLTALYYGLQMQLPVYLNAALDKVRIHGGAGKPIPAAMFYYRLEDPLVESEEELTDSEREEAILKSLRVKGLVNQDPGIVKLLDGTFTDKSAVIPVERKLDGNYTKDSSVMSVESLEELMQCVGRRVATYGQEIMDGTISLNPYVRKDEKDNACAFCPFGKVCGFDRLMPGCGVRRIDDMTEMEVLTRMALEREGKLSAKNSEVSEKKE